MKIYLIYNSKTGFTKKYAEWIAEEIVCNVVPFADMSKIAINADDVIIYGSRIHAGKIEYLDKVKTYFSHHTRQNLIVFATGGTVASAESAIDRIWAENFTQTEIKSIPHFYMQSGIDYQKMGFADRTIMKIVAKLMRRKKDKSEEEKGFEQAIQNSYDHSSKDYIMPLVNFIKNKANIL